MNIIATMIVGMIISLILYLLKNTKEFKQLISFFILWIFAPMALTETIDDFLRFSQTDLGRIIFIITLVIFTIIWVINRKRNFIVFSIVQHIAMGLNYSILLMYGILLTFKFIGQVVKFLES